MARNQKRNNKSKADKYDKASQKRSRDEGKSESTSKGRGMNDPSWYATNPELLRGSASLSYNYPLGTKINPNQSLNNANYPSVDYCVPGVMRIGVVPTVGYSDGAASPINIAARNIYAFVRHANSGHSNYDSPDLMMYIIAMDSAYSLLAYMIRAYGVMRSYSQVNRYMPRSLITAMGLDFADFQANLANFHYFINSYAVKIGSMCVPANMSYYVRHMWMYSNIYADNPDFKAQQYVFAPDGFMQFEPVEDTTGGKLTLLPFPGRNPLDEPMTYDQLVDYANSIIYPIITDEDMNIMSGDILKAFGESGIFKVVGINPDFTILPVYNPEVLAQIENATANGYCAYGDITQENNVILYTPRFETSFPVCPGYRSSKILNMHITDPQPADTMVATRLTTVSNVENPISGGIDHRPNQFGSEICTTLRIYTYYNNEGSWELGYGTPLMYVMADSSVSQITKLSTFAYHPAVRSAAVSGTEFWISMDFDNYTIVHESDLRKMHETALLSEFNVPQMGAWN